MKKENKVVEQLKKELREAEIVNRAREQGRKEWDLFYAFLEFIYGHMAMIVIKINMDQDNANDAIENKRLVMICLMEKPSGRMSNERNNKKYKKKGKGI